MGAGPYHCCGTAGLPLAAGFKRATGQASRRLAGSFPLCPGKKTAGELESCGLSILVFQISSQSQDPPQP